MWLSVLDALSQVYAAQCKVMKGAQYLLALPYYMNNLWEQIYLRGLKNLSMLVVVPNIPGDAPKILKLTEGRIPLRRTIRAMKRRNATTYYITLPEMMNEIWEYIYKNDIRLDLIVFLKQ
jgi:hypothetical protein